MGWTLNLAKTPGVLLFVFILLVFCLLPLLSLIIVLR
jgi:uncharacterized membrane protein